MHSFRGVTEKGRVDDSSGDCRSVSLVFIHYYEKYYRLIRVRYRRMNFTKEDREREKERERQKMRERAEFSWFYNAVKTTAMMKQLIKGTIAINNTFLY